MVQHIRPLTAFKKANPVQYNFCWSSDYMEMPHTSSSKGKENAGYWNYCYHEMYKQNWTKPAGESSDPFYWNINGSHTNMGTICELGKLLMAGWYYNIEDLTREIYGYIYACHKKKHAKGDPFNDSDITKTVKHIRENIGYYHHNPDELKLYILESLFADELNPLLPPPPKEIASHNKGLEILHEIISYRLKKDKNWFIKNYFDFEDYAEYLTDILDEYGIEYSTKSEYLQQQEPDNKAYRNTITQAQKTYKQQILNSIKALPPPGTTN